MDQIPSAYCMQATISCTHYWAKTRMRYSTETLPILGGNARVAAVVGVYIHKCFQVFLTVQGLHACWKLQLVIHTILYSL